MVSFTEEVQRQKKLGYNVDKAHLNAIVECFEKNGRMPNVDVDTLAVADDTKTRIKEMVNKTSEGLKLKRTR